MTDEDIQAQIAAVQALIAENEQLMSKCNSVVDELRSAMAEQLGCSIWDLDNMLERDLNAEERQAYEEQAMATLREQVPALAELASEPEAPSGLPQPGSPRPRRRMV